MLTLIDIVREVRQVSEDFDFFNINFLGFVGFWTRKCDTYIGSSVYLPGGGGSLFDMDALNVWESYG